MPDPHDLSRLVAALDEAETAWFGPATLVRICDAGDDEFDLGVRPLPEGDHPLEWLLGFTAPEEWDVFGVMSFGWGRRFADDELSELRRGVTTKRPSQSAQRVRVRSNFVVCRDGGEVSCMHVQGAPAIITVHEGDGDRPVGTIPDAIRLALGVPTPPAEYPPGELLLQAWIDDVLLAAPRPGRRWLEVDAVKALEPGLRFPVLAGRPTWAELHRHAVEQGWPDIGEEAALVAWLDEGAFSRWASGNRPSLADALWAASSRVDAEAMAYLRGAAEALGPAA